VTPAVENGVVTLIGFLTDNVTDISPVRALVGLKTLLCGGSDLGRGKLADLSPLKGMALTKLACYETLVSDLSPLKNMRLTDLTCFNSRVTDLSPLKAMPLTILRCYDTKVSDLSLLTDMPLVELRCDFKPERDSEILRSIKTLETINGKPAADFWTEVEAKQIGKKP